MRIAVFSSALPKVNEALITISKEVARHLSDICAELVTGGSTGIPAEVVKEMISLGGKVTIFSPDQDSEAHKVRGDNMPLVPECNYIFSRGLSQRSIEMVDYVDGAVILNGRIGTLSEFTIAIEEKLPVLILKNTGGISDHLDYILRVANKEFKDNFILFTEDVKTGITQLASHIIRKKQGCNTI